MSSKKKKTSEKARYRNSYLIFSILFAVIILDQLTKYILRSFVHFPRQIVIIKDFFYISYIENTGAAFGMMKNMGLFLTIISFIVIIAFVYFYKKIPKNIFAYTAVGLIMGGCIGNLIDRIIFGFVTDFIDFTFWPSFNIADSAISIGAIIAIYYVLKYE